MTVMVLLQHHQHLIVFTSLIFKDLFVFSLFNCVAYMDVYTSPVSKGVGSSGTRLTDE